MRVGVDRALQAQYRRFGNTTTRNASMRSGDLERFCVLSEGAQALLKKAFEALNLSMRGYHKLLRVARTVADIESSEIIDVVHIQEAIMYRSLDQTLDRHRQ
jgi:magnesium chelatase family protein